MRDMLPHDNCYRVAPRLIAGEYPGAPAQADARARLARHLDAGVSSFIDLTEEGELAPYAADLMDEAAARGLDARHQRRPIRDLGLPLSPASMAATLDVIDAEIAAGRTVYLHCWGGIGRTGTVVGCWLVRHGQSGEAALATIAGHWAGVAKRHRQPRSPETDEQHAYVRGWREPADGRGAQG